MAERKTQKRQSHHNLLQKRRDSMFIAEYIKRKAPDTYAEAEGFLKTLRERYPDKRDYTKTHEFLVSTTEYACYKDYYNRKRKESKTASVDKKRKESKTASVDNMALAIPLLPQNVVDENTAPLQVMPQEIYDEVIREITSDPSLQDIFNYFSNNDQDLENDIELDPSITGLSPLEKELLEKN